MPIENIFLFYTLFSGTCDCYWKYLPTKRALNFHHQLIFDRVLGDTKLSIFMSQAYVITEWNTLAINTFGKCFPKYKNGYVNLKVNKMIKIREKRFKASDLVYCKVIMHSYIHFYITLNHITAWLLSSQPIHVPIYFFLNKETATCFTILCLLVEILFQKTKSRV